MEPEKVIQNLLNCFRDHSEFHSIFNACKNEIKKCSSEEIKQVKNIISKMNITYFREMITEVIIEKEKQELFP